LPERLVLLWRGLRETQPVKTMTTIAAELLMLAAFLAAAFYASSGLLMLAAFLVH
jgi:hypothetical protein